MGEPLFADGNLSVRRMLDRDVDTVARWLSDPQVLKFYGGRDAPVGEVEIRSWLAPDNYVTPCIVEATGSAIGYVQFYPVEEAPKARYGYEPDDDVWGIDVFLADPARRGRGIGSRLVRATATYLLGRGASRVVIDPDTWNARAIRAYERAGFRKVRLIPEHELHEGVWRDAWLMEFVA